MIRSKYKKMLIISSCIVFVIMAMVSGVMMGNVIHKEHCRISKCSLCDLINISTEFCRNIGFMNIYILISAVMVPLIKAKKCNIQIASKLNLVKLKVIQLK